MTATEGPKQPDISYHPDAKKFRARTARRLAEDPSLPQQPLPANFPDRVDGPIVWEGKDWTDESQWVYNLSQTQLNEIDGALAHFNSLDKPMGFISRETFPLPTLSAELWKLADALYNGRGFFVLREIPIDKYSRKDLAIVYAGLSSHVGSGRGRQDATNAVLAHIKDLRTSHKGVLGNAAYTTDKQVFHTDIGDLIALLSIQQSASGGVSRLASSGFIYNEIAKTRPDLIHVLKDNWPLDRFGGDPPYTERPVLYNEDGHIVIQYSRRHFTGYGEQIRSTNIPPISEAQAEALDMLHFLAEKHSLGLNFQKGDIQYINSMGLLHARDAFVDDPEHTRHLVRLWLRNDELAWKTPKPLEKTWALLYSVAANAQRFPLEPEIRKTASGATK
ncbi:Clavaminate synthase-like protein [Mycena indigotica]|uniref:Clavaminate synthase-like protein n=1 Tax=Mycena indigotica TaxID=2126181 RepID=A0A8H6VWN6_9AGAR|nr:Clavaminate synthase-like protein [Mycena indigotica]KAF7294661.1 Clavaminate synthase-like protein [Mycena indigotica]